MSLSIAVHSGASFGRSEMQCCCVGLTWSRNKVHMEETKIWIGTRIKRLRSQCLVSRRSASIRKCLPQESAKRFPMDTPSYISHIGRRDPANVSRLKAWTGTSFRTLSLDTWPADECFASRACRGTLWAWYVPDGGIPPYIRSQTQLKSLNLRARQIGAAVENQYRGVS